MNADIEKLKYRLNYEFKDKRLLREALTHRSYATENSLDYHNQRLEFLGDSVLQIVLTEHLFLLYPAATEGDLTKMRSALVKQEALAIYARGIGLGDFLMMGRGELESGGHCRESTLSDAFEALLGALYLDAGLQTTKDFIIQLMAKEYPDPTQCLCDLNPKGALQEYTQKHHNATPRYDVVDLSGPDHAPSYTVAVFLNGNKLGSGTAPNRKSAESAAAREALKELEKSQVQVQGDICPQEHPAED
ncbi:MAG: ribonuclease III [Lentisphaerae bacterium GWF2_52_8]|nr:MAG: ribonuclease III [Lentisphaerae bacterium GWF2_52_8]